MGRAERRRERAKKFKRILKIVPWLKDNKTPQRFIDNLKCCSCWQCRNRRIDNGPTRQERKHDGQ